ncbi:hypothetical protein DL764_002092 [Monosporascus ibericus]|uniref:Uncharacterized protein n=1 Tax=Monosporascus ibericus TaxID=155417 RepID=A0A4V1XC09_9PEZI|nr:hypothetical protein DL764_002092 [Monosporascus ibericus]
MSVSLVLLVVFFRRQETKRTSVIANDILGYHDTVDAFGHVSVRTPEDSSTFVMTKGTATSPSTTSATHLRSWYAAVNIVPLYHSSDVQDVLVAQPRFGASPAEAFEGNGAFPEHVFVFMKQHGFVECAATIEEAVYQAAYAKEVAAAETAQVVLRQVYHGAGVESAGGVGALSPEQVEGG